MRGFYLMVLIFTIVSCKRVCENVEVGDTEFAAETEQFLKYNEGETLVFTTANGEDLNFTVSTELGEYFICQKVTCDPLDPYKSSYCEYIAAPQSAIYLNTDSTLIAIEASVFAYEPETDLLYDAVRFTLSHQNSTALASHITDVKFENPSFDRNKIDEIDDFMVEKSSLVLGENTYQNVLVCEDEQLALYFSKELGIIGFKIGARTYTLKN